jgi:hypothetical protein
MSSSVKTDLPKGLSIGIKYSLNATHLRVIDISVESKAMRNFVSIWQQTSESVDREHAISVIVLEDAAD